MYRGSDRWATVDLSKLDPNCRRIATKLKKKVVSAQMGKKFDDPDFELSKNCVQTSTPLRDLTNSVTRC